jgi:hypothetical protein
MTMHPRDVPVHDVDADSDGRRIEVGDAAHGWLLRSKR